MLRVNVTDASKSRELRLSKNGQLFAAPYAYDETVFKELAEANTAYNFYIPKSGCNFVITGIIAKADKQVSATVDADVVVYEGASEVTTTASKTLMQLAMVEGDLLPLTGLNILVNEGVFINAKTTDDDIHMTIMGYYIPA